MAKNWCKIIELDEYDVLVQKHFEDNTHCIQVTLKKSDEGATIKAIIGIGEESEANKFYDKFSKENAEKIINTILN